MSKPIAPSMPTPRQIREALGVIRETFPDAKVKRVGPDGIEFAYGDDQTNELRGFSV